MANLRTGQTESKKFLLKLMQKTLPANAEKNPTHTLHQHSPETNTRSVARIFY
jgi:hypothetical protein